jgi:hypothetical protein
MYLVESMLACKAPHARDQKLRRSDATCVVCAVVVVEIPMKTLEKSVRKCAPLFFSKYSKRLFCTLSP